MTDTKSTKEVPFCYPNSSEDCYKLFASILSNQRDMLEAQTAQGKVLDKMSTAVIGDEYHPDDGIVQKQAKLDARVKLLERAYIGLIAIGSFIMLMWSVLSNDKIVDKIIPDISSKISLWLL